MIKASIIGGAGYAGGELIRLLLNHAHCEISEIISQSQAGKYIFEVHQDLTGRSSLTFKKGLEFPCDVLFLCGGHGQSEIFLGNHDIHKDTCVIDLSADFRLNREGNDFIYGLTELNKAKIKASKKIANCGCFATCIQLGLLPLAHLQKLTHDIHITAITGSTGAGQKLLPTTHFSWRNNNISVYKAFSHQHLGEIIQSLKKAQPGFDAPLNFIPIRGDFTRGIFASMYTECDLSASHVKGAYQDYYEDSPFVHISDTPISLKQVVNTNNNLIYVEKHGNKIRIESALDNLLKGASGMAVQNMNIVFGFEEDEGLKLKASAF